MAENDLLPEENRIPPDRNCTDLHYHKLKIDYSNYV